MFDCKKCIDKCKANCCFLHVFPIIWWEKNKKHARNVTELHTLDDAKLVLTKEMRCAFFDKGMMGCAVYQDRPETCSKFGLIDQLPCPWQDKDGKLRTDKETKNILAQADEMFKKMRGEIREKGKQYTIGESENR